MSVFRVARNLLMPFFALFIGLFLFYLLSVFLVQTPLNAQAKASARHDDCNGLACAVHLPLFLGRNKSGRSSPTPSPTPSPSPTAMPTPSSTPIVLGDLGDAPDSQGIGITMTAYVTDVVSGTIGNFPTVYISGTRSGPFHRAVSPGVFLGTRVSRERNAHQLPDDDSVTNLASDMDVADRDLADDSQVVAQGLEFPCAKADLAYTITVESGFQSGLSLPSDPGTTPLPEPVETTEVVYVNAWLDLNRDGTWNEVGHCDTVLRYSEEIGYWEDPTRVSVAEWVIQDLLLVLEPGIHVITTTVVTLHFTQGLDISPTWLRLTVGDSDGDVLPHDGCGPATGHPFGETEDIKLYWNPGPTLLPRAWWRG